MKRLIACSIASLALATGLAFTSAALADPPGAPSGKGYTSGNGGKNSHSAAPIKDYGSNGGQGSGSGRGEADCRALHVGLPVR